ncbi:hypothetical protein CR513_04133, partial [Mucuna pruriens]
MSKKKKEELKRKQIVTRIQGQSRLTILSRGKGDIEFQSSRKRTKGRSHYINVGDLLEDIRNDGLSMKRSIKGPRSEEGRGQMKEARERKKVLLLVRLTRFGEGWRVVLEKRVVIRGERTRTIQRPKVPKRNTFWIPDRVVLNRLGQPEPSWPAEAETECIPTLRHPDRMKSSRPRRVLLVNSVPVVDSVSNRLWSRIAVFKCMPTPDYPTSTQPDHVDSCEIMGVLSICYFGMLSHSCKSCLIFYNLLMLRTNFGIKEMEKTIRINCY